MNALVAHNDRVSGSWNDGDVHEAEPQKWSRQWLLAGAGAAVVVAIVAVAGVASLWDSDPDVPEHSNEPPPPREYGGPLWFTVGSADETQLVTNTNPRNSTDGPGSEYSGVARYLASEKCFTDGTNLLVWPRGSRPLSGSRAGVAPAEGVQVFDGETFRARAETINISQAEDFPPTQNACAPSGNALSLSVVRK